MNCRRQFAGKHFNLLSDSAPPGSRLCLTGSACAVRIVNLPAGSRLPGWIVAMTAVVAARLL
jgi:hypothetical protein